MTQVVHVTLCGKHVDPWAAGTVPVLPQEGHRSSKAGRSNWTLVRTEDSAHEHCCVFSLNLLFIYLFNLFILLFIFGSVGSSLLCEGPL